MAKKLLTSPKGAAVYPHLNTPDTKFDADGVYHVKLRCSEKEPQAQALIKLIDEKMVESVAKAREAVKDDPKKLKKVKACDDKPYSFDTDDDDKRTGTVTFTFKMKAQGKSRKTGEEFTQKPAIFNAQGKPVTEVLRIGGGSTLRVSYEIVLFPPTGKTGAGVSLRLKGVQVIELVEWGQGDASYHGFNAEESETEEAAPEGSSVEAEAEDDEPENDDF